MSNEFPIVVSFGGGTNSTAMLCGFRDRKVVPGLILFADTGNEKPHTYEHVAVMNVKCQEWWGIPIETVVPTLAGKPITLEQDCLNKGMLPSIAYGGRNRSCSDRFKHNPLERRLKEWCDENAIGCVTKAIGYGADEMNRGRTAPESKLLRKGIKEVYWYPLREWGWGRNECVDAIQRHGLPQPGKSACYFCPASRRSEVFKLRKEHPELMERALAMEAKAQLTHRTTVGLGGIGNLWADWLKNEDAQGKFIFDLEPVHIPCGCYDGGDTL